MNPSLERLRAEIRFDREAFARRVDELSSIKLSDDPDSAAQRAQAAVALHHTYGSLESIMVRISRFLEGDVPKGADWHQSLLHSMSLYIDGVRPAVFAPKTVEVLRRLLGFRHFFRHAYAVELDSEQLAALRDDVVAASQAIEAELTTLDEFLLHVSDLNQS